MSLIKIDGLKRHYEMTSGTVKALDGIDIEIEQGERVILLGPSGSGKFYSLNCLSALDSPTDGTYSFDGNEVPRNDSEKMTSFRRENIDTCFNSSIFADLTVRENIQLIQELSGKTSTKALELLELVGLENEVSFSRGDKRWSTAACCNCKKYRKATKFAPGDELTETLTQRLLEKSWMLL